jgi:hypothetical protein
MPWDGKARIGCKINWKLFEPNNSNDACGIEKAFGYAGEKEREEG